MGRTRTGKSSRLRQFTIRRKTQVGSRAATHSELIDVRARQAICGLRIRRCRGRRGSNRSSGAGRGFRRGRLLFELHVPGAQFFHQICCFSEWHIAIVVAVNKEERVKNPIEKIEAKAGPADLTPVVPRYLLRLNQRIQIHRTL
jgi:hypothetical protein